MKIPYFVGVKAASWSCGSNLSPALDASLPGDIPLQI
jgi:hypothetical protein